MLLIDILRFIADVMAMVFIGTLGGLVALAILFILWLAVRK